MVRKPMPYVSLQPASRLNSKTLLRLLIRKQGLIYRILVCWALASFVMYTDERTNFDTRFQIRGAQTASSELVLLWLRPADINRYYDIRTQTLINLNELTEFSDGFFWDQRLWYQMLKTILDQKPKSIGVSVYFGESVGNIEMSRKESEVFFDSRVFWATQVNSFDQMITPRLAKSDLSNVGQYEVYRDEDGLVRKIISSWSGAPHISEKITGKKLPRNSPSQLINFRGPSRVFTSVTAEEVLNNEIRHDFFKDKIVLIGVDSGSSVRFLTPVGLLTRPEIIAHIVDNLVENRWIRKFHPGIYALYALLLVLLATFVVTQYPQSVAFAFLFWMGLLCVAISAWAFDSLNVWIPGVSTVILILIVWVVFVGYQATKVERRNYMLEQEQKYLHELEQLKSNFVSLISHDLKTPLAKIQGVLERLKKTTSGDKASTLEDFSSLESYTNELNHYIQSILKVMRVESRDFQINKTSTDLNEMIEEVVGFLRPLAEVKKLTFQLQLEPLFLVDLDPTLIREVIHNIIENAIKYSPENKEITIKSFETEDNEVGFLVQDQGEGIPTDEVASVWGKFVRGHSQSHKSKGTGLGLYLVKYFVELHAGRVTLQSVVGQGTTVGFFLPLQTDSEVSV